MIARYAVAAVELGQAALDFGANGFFIFLKPDLAFRLHFEGIEEYVFHALERAAMKALLDEALAGMSRDFDQVYASEGRPSIPPERLVRASTLQILYSIRSERLLCEQLDYNLLFRWFVGLSIDEPIWDHSSFTKNRDRLIEAKVARKLLRRL